MSKTAIEQNLRQTFKPTFLEVVDESYLHAGHNHDAKQGGTHFKVIIVSDAFKSKSLVNRHRLVYQTLQQAGITYHALAITAKTQDEYSA